VADHQAFAVMLLRQIVGAHQALLRAEAAPFAERAAAVEAARLRLGMLVRQASAQFPAPRGLVPSEDGAAAQAG
jgi:hypothetical protein